LTEDQSSIDVEKIKQLIKEILPIIDEVPELYKETCFRVLFSEYLKRSLELTAPEMEKISETKPVVIPSGLPIPEEVRVFFSQQEIPESSLSSLFTYENGIFIRKYKIAAGTRAAAQIRVALLVALENALGGEKFEFSADLVRQRCRQYDCYEETNFNRNFERSSELFKSLSDRKHVELSPKGKTELAKIIKEIAK
jgi:hypothetical protein